MMIDGGAIKKCDTVEELERELGLREGILVNEVKKWNAACEAARTTHLCTSTPRSGSSR